MKKLIALLLAMVMVFALAACKEKEEKNEQNNENGGAQVETAVAESALEILENIWGKYADEEKFAIMGGTEEYHWEQLETNDAYIPAEAPLNYDLAYAENLPYSYMIAEGDVASIDDAATMKHGQLANNFSAGAYHLKDGTDVAAFAENAKETFKNNMWMCGQPDVLIVADLGDGYVVVAFGVQDIMETFKTNLKAAYADANIVVEAPLA